MADRPRDPQPRLALDRGRAAGFDSDLEVGRGPLLRAGAEDPLEHLRALPQRRPEEGGAGPDPASPGTRGRQVRRGHRARQRRGEPGVREGRGGRDAPQEQALGPRGRGRPGLDRGGGSLSGRAGHPAPRGARLVVAPADPPARGAGREAIGRFQDPHAHRRVRPGQARGERALPGPRGRPGHPDPPPQLRPDRPAALAGRRRRVRERPRSASL